MAGSVVLFDVLAYSSALSENYNSVIGLWPYWLMFFYDGIISSMHATLTQCCLNVGPLSATLAQRKPALCLPFLFTNSIGLMVRSPSMT